MTRRLVLVVDDDDDVREITRMALEVVGGWEVVTASDGFAAIETARRIRPDAVFLDVMMPGMDGPTTFGRLQQDEATAGLPVILLTAKVQSHDSKLWDTLPIAGVISKPFDPMTLATTAARILGWDD